MCKPAPLNPIDLSTHLIDGHHQPDAYIDSLDADELRRYHVECHTTGLPDHEHEAAR